MRGLENKSYEELQEVLEPWSCCWSQGGREEVSWRVAAQQGYAGSLLRVGSPREFRCTQRLPLPEEMLFQSS